MFLPEPSRTLAKISCLAPVLEGPLGGLCPRQPKSQTIPLMTTEMSSEQLRMPWHGRTPGPIPQYTLASAVPTATFAGAALLPVSTQSINCRPAAEVEVVETLWKRLARALIVRLVPKLEFKDVLDLRLATTPGHSDVAQNGAYTQHSSLRTARKRKRCVVSIIWHSYCPVARAWTPGPE